MAPSIICLVFSLFVITETTDISWSVPNMTVDDVTMSPDGFYYLLVGRTVNLTCWVTSSTSNSSSLVIALNDSLRDDVITPDDATAQVTVTNMAAGTFFYRCCVSSCQAMSKLNPSDPNISAVTLKYGDPPPLVSNVTCASLDFINLDCSLTISGAGQDVAWILSYCIKDYIPTDDPLACPGDITSRTKCDPSPQWPPPGKGVMLFHCAEEVLEYQVYRIYVDGDSHFGRTSYLTEVYTGPSIVQYSAVRGLRVGPNVTSTSITLLWDNPVRIFGAQPMYSVVVTQSEMGYHEDFESKVSSYKVPSLRPATTYLAELRAKPRSSPYWNKPTYINRTTLDAAPGVPPGLKPGMYTRWEDGVHVMVFWQAVPRALRNGKITHHRVCLDLPNNVSLFCKTFIPGDQFHYLLVLPEGAGNCTVTVQAGTRAALSKKSSLRIPNIGQAPQRPLYVTVEQQDDSSYNVSWVLANHNVRLDHVYVTWCQAFRTSEEVTCINDVHSVEIDGSATSYTVTLAMDPGLRKGAWFGVATSADDVSDGTTWNQCIFVKYGAMGSPPAMNVLSNERTAWLPLGFSYCDVSLNKGRPYVYEVSYQSTNTTSCSDVNCTDVLTDDPKPVNLAAIVGVTSGLVTMVIVAVLCVVYHRRRLNPLKKIQIDLGMFRDMEHGDSGDKNRLSSENQAFLNIHADPTPVSSSTAHEDDVTRMESNQSKDDGHAELRVLQTEQPLRPADTDSGNASDAAMVAVSAGPAGGVEGPEYAPGNIQDKATSEPGSYPSSGYKSTLNRSKASRSSTGGSVTLAQVPGHLSGHQDLGAPSKPDETTPSLLPSNKQSRTASRVESQHEILAEVDQGGYVVYPGQVAAGVRNVEQRKKDEERLTDDLEYVRCNVSTDVPNILTDNFEYVRCNVSTDVPNASTEDLEYVRCNVSTDIPNASTDDLEYVRCNVSTDVPNILTDNFEYVRCNVSADVPNASTEDLEYVRCNVSTDVPNILTDNFEYVRCSAHSSIVGHVQPEST